MATDKGGEAPPKEVKVIGKGRGRSKLPLILIVILAGAGAVLKFTVFKETFRYSGTLEATKVDLSSQVASKIEAIKVQEGDHVKEGDSLVGLSCDDVKVAADLANENYTRSLRLLRGGSGSQENLDQTKNRKDDAEVRLRWCNIQSPIPGSVLSRYHE